MAERVTQPAGNVRGLTRARTSFVGRTDAIEKVAGPLARYRLVTVADLTRLALQEGII